MKIPTTSIPSIRLAIAAAVGIACSITVASAQTTLTYDSDTTAPANDGPGVWNTTSANWYNGTTDVVWSNGLGDTAIFGAGGTGGAVTVGTVNVGTIQFNATTTTGYTLSTGTITLGSGIVNNNGTLGSTISAKISGTAGLAYSGTGTGSVTLSGANDYTGITTLTGTVRISNGNASALGSSAGASASTLGANYTQVGNVAGVTITGQTVAEAFVINGTGNSNGAIRFSNNSTLSSLVQLGSSSLISGAFSNGNTINGNIDLQTYTLSTSNVGGTINGVIGGTGSVSIGSNSIFAFTNTANSFSGNLTLNNSGGVTLGANGVLGSSTLVFASGTIQSSDATARTVSNTIGSFNGNAIFGQTTTQTGTLNFTYNTAAASLGTTARTFTTNVDTTFATGFTGTGSGGIIKAGAASLILNGTNTYAGTTTVNAGTLGGTGSISGAVTINTGAALTGGTTTTTGNLTVGMLTLTSGSTLNLQVSSTANDLITSTGTLTYGGATLTIGSIGGFALTSTSGNYDLLDATTFSANLGSVSVDGTALTLSNNVWTGTAGNTNLSFDQATGILGVATAVPEPSTWAGACLLTGLAALRLLKHRRSATKQTLGTDVSLVS